MNAIREAWIDMVAGLAIVSAMAIGLIASGMVQ